MIEFHCTGSKPSVEVNLTPLIDIIFNLLIFLLITAVFTAKGISLNLPEAATSEAVSSGGLEIGITSDDKIVVNHEEIAGSQLERILKSKLENPQWDGNEKIYIKACRDSSVGMLVTVMDRVRKAGFDNAVIAAGAAGNEHRMSRP